MLTIDKFAITFVNCYLVIYLLLLQCESTLFYAFMMVFFSPLIIVWMVYTVLKYGRYDGPELGYDEFAYQDKNKNEPGVV